MIGKRVYSFIVRFISVYFKCSVFLCNLSFVRVANLREHIVSSYVWPLWMLRATSEPIQTRVNFLWLAGSAVTRGKSSHVPSSHSWDGSYRLLRLNVR